MYNAKKQILSVFKGSILGFAVASFAATTLHAETLEEKLNRVKSEISATEERQVQLEDTLSKLNETSQKRGNALGVEQTSSNRYNAKIAEAKTKQKNNKVETSAKEEKAEVKTEPENVQPQTKKVSLPMERSPKYVAPKQKSKTRRPFTRSSNEYGETIYYAGRFGTEKLSFAKEEVQGYTGTTEENVFVFSENLANYCEMDTNSLDKTEDCLNKIIKNMTTGSQTLNKQVNEMMQETMIDTTSQTIAETLEHKNDSSGYEKEVLLPLQERSSQATDERGDIEVMTLSDMEALKLKNKLLQIYSSQLSLNALKDFTSYEIKDTSITDINEEYNAEKSK